MESTLAKVRMHSKHLEEADLSVSRESYGDGVPRQSSNAEHVFIQSLHTAVQGLASAVQDLTMQVEAQGKTIKTLQSAQASFARRSDVQLALPSADGVSERRDNVSSQGSQLQAESWGDLRKAMQQQHDTLTARIAALERNSSHMQDSAPRDHIVLDPHLFSSVSLMSDRLDKLEGGMESLHSLNSSHSHMKEHVEASKAHQGQLKEGSTHFVTHNLFQEAIIEIKEDIINQARSLVQFAERWVFDELKGEEQIIVEYRFKESIWDLAMLNGLVKSKANVMVTGVLIVINFVIVVAFCTIIVSNFLEHPFGPSALKGLKDFRSTFAHDEKYAHLYSDGTLASQICRADSFEYGLHYLMYGNAQLATLQTISSYLGHDIVTKIFGGPLMCMLACYCWTLTVAREFMQVHHFCKACLVIPFATHTRFEYVDGQIVLTSWAYWRKYLLLCITTVRFGCCLCLVTCGGIWLSLTTDVEALILNAVALDFVLNIDELLYDAAAPQKSRAFLSSLASLQEQARPVCKGLDQFSLSILVVAPVVCIVFFVLDVLPLIDTMHEAQDLLCGRDLDFMFALDASGMIWFDKFSAKAKRTPEDNAMLALTKRAKYAEIAGDSDHYGMYLDASYPGFIHSLAVRPLEQLIDEINMACVDLLDVGPVDDASKKTFQKFLSTKLGKPFKSCADAKAGGACGEFLGRYLCPHTCTCDLPNSTVPTSAGLQSGCPSSCLRSKYYLERLKKKKCTDMSLVELQGEAFWKAWAAHVNQSRWDDVPGVADTMIKEGCGFLNMTGLSKSKDLICQGRDVKHQLRPMAPICPTTCRCSDPMSSEGCAPQCRPTPKNGWAPPP